MWEDIKEFLIQGKYILFRFYSSLLVIVLVTICTVFVLAGVEYCFGENKYVFFGILFGGAVSCIWFLSRVSLALDDREEGELENIKKSDKS